MTNFPYLSPWLECLLQLAPPRGLVHIGAGGGGATQYPYLSMPRLLVIDADARQVAYLHAQLLGHAKCQIVHALVSSQDGEANFHTLSQSNESGLCPHTSLRSLWPNIKTRFTTTLPTVSLQSLLSEAESGASAHNWVAIDCLPSGPILQGAGALSAQWDVVVARALKDAPMSETDHLLGLQELCQQLATHGLSLVASEEENHPNVVRALFVRDHSKQLNEVKRNAREQCAAAAIRASDANEQLFQMMHENKKLLANIAALTRARDELVGQSVEKAHSIAILQSQLADANEKAALLAELSTKFGADNRTLSNSQDKQPPRLDPTKTDLQDAV